MSFDHGHHGALSPSDGRCKKCKGKKVTKEKKRVEFMIDPGTEDGERIALKGEGDALVRYQSTASRLNLPARRTSRRRHLPHQAQGSPRLPPPPFLALVVAHHGADILIRIAARHQSRRLCASRRTRYPHRVEARRKSHQPQRGDGHPRGGSSATRSSGREGGSLGPVRSGDAWGELGRASRSRGGYWSIKSN